MNTLFYKINLIVYEFVFCFFFFRVYMVRLLYHLIPEVRNIWIRVWLPYNHFSLVGPLKLVWVKVNEVFLLDVQRKISLFFFCLFCFCLQLQGTKLFKLGQARPGRAYLAYNLVLLDRQATSEGVLSTRSGIFSGGLWHIWIPVIFGLISHREALLKLHSFHVMVVTLWMVASGWIWVLIWQFSPHCSPCTTPPLITFQPFHPQS